MVNILLRIRTYGGKRFLTVLISIIMFITQIIEYPLKSYMTRIELDDGEYDMAAVF